MACQGEEQLAADGHAPNNPSAPEAQQLQYRQVLFKALMSTGGGMRLTETSVRVKSQSTNFLLICARLRHANRRR